MHALIAILCLAAIVAVWRAVLWLRKPTEWEQEQEDREMCQRCTDYDCGATCFARQLAEP